MRFRRLFISIILAVCWAIDTFLDVSVHFQNLLLNNSFLVHVSIGSKHHEVHFFRPNWSELALSAGFKDHSHAKMEGVRLDCQLGIVNYEVGDVLTQLPCFPNHFLSELKIQGHNRHNLVFFSSLLLLLISLDYHLVTLKNDSLRHEVG